MRIMAEAKYVRLASHLTRGGRYDINSNFGISGFDVVPMPDKEDNPAAHRWVRGEMAAGRIESASRAEYEEVHPDLAPKDDEPFQERSVQERVRSAHRKVRAGREEGEQTDAFEADERRRKATIKAQKAQGKRGSGSGSKAAAEAEDEADAETNAHLRREAEARATGGGRAQVSGARDLVEDDDEDEGDEYDALGKQALVEEADRRGIAKSGSAEDLRARLRDHDAASEGDEDDPDDDDEGDDTGDDGDEGEEPGQ